MRPSPLTLPAVFAVVAGMAIVNSIGCPFCQTPPRTPFKTYGGNDFGWPFTYMSTNFTESQWRQMRLPDGRYQLPQKSDLAPTDLLHSDHDVVEHSSSALLMNGWFAICIMAWTATIVEMWQRSTESAPNAKIPAVCALAMLTVLLALATRSGYFYNHISLPYYDEWYAAKVACCPTIAMVTLWTTVRFYRVKRTAQDMASMASP